MSIPANTTGKVQYTGDGTTKTFPLTFPILKTTDGVYAIRVSVADASGENVEVLTEGTDYTVDDTGNLFCDVVMDTAPASGKVVSIIYSNEFSQLYEPTDFTRLPAKSLINAFDKLTAICIQMSEELQRCVKESVESPVDPQVVIDKVNALYLHLSALTALSEHLTEIDGVYGELAKVVIAANDISNINIVAADKDAIDALVGIITQINSCYTNMTAILDAPNQASAAAGSAMLAQDWAVKMNGKVGDVDYSSKYYAARSKDWATSQTVVEDGKYGAKYYALQADDANDAAQSAKTSAAASATLAEKWASQMDDPVSGSDYSAKKYAMDAQEAAVQAGYSVDPLFTERDFTEDAPPSNLSWVRTDQMDTMFDGNLYKAAFNALKDGEPIATQHNGIRLLTGSSVTITDGQIYSSVSVAPSAGVIAGKIEVPNFSWAGVRQTVEAALDNDDFSYFVYSKAFGLQIANYADMTTNTWYEMWNDGFIGLDVKWTGTNLVFRPRVYQSGSGWVTGNEATKTPVPYVFNCQVTLRADSNTDPFRIIFYNSDENVSSTKDTSLTNAQVKAGLNIYDSTYYVKTITYYPISGVTVNYSINASDAQLLQCYSATPFAYTVQEYQSYNSQWTSYDYTGTDTYTIGGSTYTINYKLYDGKKFVRNDPTYLQVKLIFAAFGKQPYYCVDNTNKKFMLPCQQADHGIITIHSNLTGTTTGETALLNIYEDGYFEVVGKVSAGKSLTFRQDVGDIYSLMASAGTISYSSKTLTLSAACSFYVTGGIGDNGKLKRTKHHYSLVGMHQDGMDIDVEYIEGKIEEKVSQMSASVPEFLGQYMFSEVNPHKACWLVSDGEYKLKQGYPDMWNQLQTELDDTIAESDVKTIDGKQYIKRGLPVVTTSDTITDEDFVVNAVAGTFRVPVKPRGCIVSRNYNNWYLLFYVGNTVENIEKIAADVIAGSLPTKANRNLSNLTETGNTTLIHKNSVSKRSINFISGSTTKNDGFIYYGGVAAASGGPHKFKVLVVDPDDSDAVIFQKTCQVGDGDDFGIMTPVGVGCKVTASYNNPPASSSLKFIFPNGISSDHIFNPLLFWDQQQYGDLSRYDLKAWTIVPYDHSNDEFLAYTTAAVPQVGDTVWLLKSNSYWTENPTVTRTATILALGEGYGSKRAIYVSGCTSGVYYERHPWYDRNGSFSS